MPQPAATQVQHAALQQVECLLQRQQGDCLGVGPTTGDCVVDPGTGMVRLAWGGTGEPEPAAITVGQGTTRGTADGAVPADGSV